MLSGRSGKRGVNVNIIEEHAARIEYKARMDKLKRVTAEQTCELMTFMFLRAVAKEFGFGTARLNRVMTEVKVQLADVEKGVVTVGELRKWVDDMEVDLS
jgi:hypothetical protein